MVGTVSEADPTCNGVRHASVGGTGREVRIRRRAGIRAAACSPLVSLAHIACTAFREDPTMLAIPLDAGPVDAAPVGAVSVDPIAHPPCDRSKPFGPPTLVPGLATAVRAPSIAGLRLSPDQLTGYFQAGGSVGRSNQDIYVATRPTVGAPFTDATPIAGPEINTDTDDEQTPAVSGDGLTLVFARSVHGIGFRTLSRLFYTARASASSAFAGPRPLANFAVGDTNPFLREDGLVLYITYVPTSAGDGGNFDIYRSFWNGSDFGPPIEATDLNTSFKDYAAVVTPDDLTVYFGSDRPDPQSKGNGDIWVATRTSPVQPFSTPAIVPEVSSALPEAPTYVTRDGCALYYSIFTDDAEHPDGVYAEYVAEKPAR